MLGPPLLDLPANAGGDGRLDESVEGWWSSTTTGAGVIVPDGSVDVISVSGLAPFLAGPDVAPRPVELPVGRRLVGIRLRPGVAAQLLGSGVERVVGQQVALEQIWSRIELDRLDDDLGGVHTVWPDAEPPPDAAVALARAIGRAVSPGWRPDLVVEGAVASIVAGEAPAVTDLGSRQLRRRFTAAVGYGPALFRRIARLDRFTDLLATEPRRPLADLAGAAGFYDQAHLTRDCRELLGTTPARWRSTR